MKKSHTLFLSSLVVLTACAQPESSKEIAKQISLVENSLSGAVKIEGENGFNLLDRMAFHKVKGLSIAVIKDYKVIWTKGYGWADEGEKKPVTDNTMFQVASVSKSVNSMGVLKLVQDKKLDLNTDINAYLTSWKFPYDSVSGGQKITALNLLTHTGGISNGAAMYVKEDTIPTAIQVLNGAKGSRFVWSEPNRAHSVMAPNKMSQYSNPGVGITQILINDITRKSYETYMKEAVFRPLGMTNSCYEEASLKNRNIATGYSGAGMEMPGKHVIIPTQSAGGLWTTASDLAKFIIELQLSYEGKSNKVLSQTMVKKMMTPYVDSLVGAGVFLRPLKKGGPRYFGHSGSMQGFKSEYYGSLEGGNGVVVLINTAGNSERIIPELINAVASVYNWKGFYEPVIKRSVSVPDSVLQKYVGVYSAMPGKFTTILKKEDGYYQFADGLSSKMYFSSQADYFNLEFPSEKHFVLDKTGKVKGYDRTFNGNTFFVKKILSPDSLTGTSAFFGDIAWHLLISKEYKTALAYFERSLGAGSESLMPYCNIAHCYLFMKEYDKAIKVYKEYFDRNVSPDEKFKDIIRDDFVLFKKSGFDASLMDKAVFELKLKMPKEYWD